MQSTILLADDDVELSDLLKEYFESEGFDVHTAYDGAAALQRARQPGLDLMVLDIMMPKMNGMDVLKELRDAGITTLADAPNTGPVRAEIEKLPGQVLREACAA